MPIFNVTTTIRPAGRVPTYRGIFSNTLDLQLLPSEKPMLRLGVAKLGASSLNIVRSTGHFVHLIEDNYATVIFPRRGKIEADTGRRTVVGSDGDVLFFTPNTRKTVVKPDGGSESEFEAVVALFPRERLSASSYKTIRLGIEANLGTVMRHRSGRAMLQFCQFLRSEASQPQSSLGRGRLLKSCDALLMDLFDQFLTDIESEVADPSKAAHLGIGQVRRAEEIMRSRAGDEVSIADIAKELGVTPRALQLAFRKHHDTTPRDVLSRIRLERAKTILQSQPGVTVTEVALECAFHHLGRFSRSYRDLHGELPSETLRVARRSPI